MKHSTAEKSSVAWFRLAECIKRKERERAFLLYRLLIHSFEDAAFLKKLEGDMWLEFDKTVAIESYLVAAHIYKQRSDYYDAYVIYKNLCEMDPHTLSFVDLALAVINFTSAAADKPLLFLQKLLILCRNYDFAAAFTFFCDYKKDLSLKQQEDFYYEFITQAASHKYDNEALIENALKDFLVTLLTSKDDTKVSLFLTTLKTHNEKWYQKAQTFLLEQQ